MIKLQAQLSSKTRNDKIFISLQENNEIRHDLVDEIHLKIVLWFLFGAKSHDYWPFYPAHTQ